MSMYSSAAPASVGRARLWVASAALSVASPALVIFIATNIANAGNLAFNMIFSRLLSPAAFHDLMVILTLKLSVLSVLGAGQMAVSQLTAAQDVESPLLTALARLSRLTALASGLLLLPLIALIVFSDLSATLGLGSDLLIPILLVALPVAAPLCIARGAALGRMSVRAIVISTNLEMAIRLVGAVLVWWLGLGVAGIVAVLAISVYAGWFPVREEPRLHTHDSSATGGVVALLRRIISLSWPFAILQLSMVGHLDGDILLSAMILPEEEASLVAGLTLIQRIQFYAFFGLAGILLPMVTAAAREGRSTLRPALPVIGLVMGSGAILSALAVLWPDTVIALVAGSSYSPAAPNLIFAVLAGVCFTGTYLAATFLAALGDRTGIYLSTVALPIAIAALWIGASQGGLDTMMATKAAVQGGLFIAASACVLRALSKRA